jgi:hypothetical protein
VVCLKLCSVLVTNPQAFHMAQVLQPATELCTFGVPTGVIPNQVRNLKDATHAVWVRDRHEAICQGSFNGRLRVDFQRARVTSDGACPCLRELDERLGSANSSSGT